MLTLSHQHNSTDIRAATFIGMRISEDDFMALHTSTNVYQRSAHEQAEAYVDLRSPISSIGPVTDMLHPPVDDRYDPYPLPAKRRAVSPSVSYLRESQPSLFTPRTPNGNGRAALPHPIAIPVVPSSGASSPVVTPSGLSGSRPLSWGPQSVLSSPTLRAQMGLGSPVLRPMMRRREEREVDGAGEGVHGLSLE